MRGKAGVVIGLAVGYVLGARAGRERYEQIKEQALKVWNLDPVQAQVDKAREFGKTAALAVPTALWDGAVKLTKSVQNSGTPGQKLDSAIRETKKSAGGVAKAAEQSAAATKKAADDAAEDVAKALREHDAS
ncbi:MAG: hypothetical protein KKH75_02415 [Actinobacteria bacterium]|nr:hypothetical protein [Actinomycetota bacterium]